MEDYVYDNYDGEQYFKEIVMDYLKDKKLWNSDKLVKPEELREIFLDIVTDGEQIGRASCRETVSR